MSNGIARAGWDIDLRDGEAREDAFVHVLLKTRVEHKRDYKAVATGNVAIEFKQSKLPNGQGDTWLSGIARTEAEWWAIEYDEECWVILPTDRLKALARAAIEKKRTRWVGDYNRYYVALVPLEWLVKPLRVV